MLFMIVLAIFEAIYNVVLVIGSLLIAVILMPLNPIIHKTLLKYEGKPPWWDIVIGVLRAPLAATQGMIVAVAITTHTANPLNSVKPLWYVIGIGLAVPLAFKGDENGNGWDKAIPGIASVICYLTVAIWPSISISPFQDIGHWLGRF